MSLDLKKLRGTRARRPLAVAPTPDSDDLTVALYGVIGWDVWADDVLLTIAESTAAQITVLVNSPGGDAFDGIALYNALAAHPAHVTVDVQGLAASAASIVAMAGNQRIMRPGSTMMIHDAMMFAGGNAAELRKAADSLDVISEGIAGVYAAAAGGTVDTWRDAMLAETWLTADEAVAAGLAHSVEAGCGGGGKKPGSSDGEDQGDEPESDGMDEVVQDLLAGNWRWKNRSEAPPPTRLIAALTRSTGQHAAPDVVDMNQRVTALRAALVSTRR